MLLNILGIVLIGYGVILTATGPELKSPGFIDRIKETLVIYRYVLAIMFVGAYLTGI